MTIDIFHLLKKDYPKLRVAITQDLRKEIFLCLSSSTKSLAKVLKIKEVSLRRKFLGVKGYSFKLDELLYLAQKAKINKEKVLSCIQNIKTGDRASWSRFSREIYTSEGLVEGLGYYIGDGRMKTNRGLSAVSIDIDTIKFFLNWIIKYFGAQNENIQVNISLSCSNFNTYNEKRKWSKSLGINVSHIRSKHNYKKHHKPLIEVCYFRTVAKLILDRLIPRIKKECLLNKSLATAYIKGIMAAEGSPRYDEKSCQRAVHLKMKDKQEVEYIIKLFKLLNFTPSLLYSRGDKTWIASVTGYYELEKLEKMNIFQLNDKRRKKFKKILDSYHHQQAKKGQVKEFYLANLFQFEKKYEKYCTAKQLSKYLKRDKTRVIYVLRRLEKNGFLEGKRIRKAGRPFKFTLTEVGKRFISKQSLLAYQPH